MITPIPIFNVPIYDNGKKVGEYDLLNQQSVQIKNKNNSQTQNQQAEPNQVQKAKAERSWWWLLLFGPIPKLTSC
ncbi:MAG: hypothetical protein V3T21_03470 [Candidatus Margulisiibacteriota bacterium]